MFTQQDVQEFSCILLDVIEKKVDSSKRDESTSNFIKDLFCGTMVNYIKCTQVNYQSVREETFYDIQLPVKGFKDIYDSLKDYTQEEDLSGDNKYDTEKFGKQDAKKGIKFKKLPEILFFHLRRFEYDLEQDENTKIMQEYKFFNNIDMGEYLEDKEKGKQGCSYSLLAIMVHMGSRSNSGHYIAYIKPESRQWYKFNDESISKVSEKYVHDMSFGAEFTKVALDSQSRLLSQAFKLKKTTTNMSSQAYMLVYVRTSLLKENTKTIDINEISPFIRDKVDRENRENRRLEYWNSHQLFYLIFPELLVDTEMRGLVLDHQGGNDGEKVARLMFNPKLRYAHVFERHITISEWLRELACIIGVDSKQLIIYKFDNQKSTFLPLFSKKIVEEADSRKLTSLFRQGQTGYDTPILFIYVLSQTEALLEEGEVTLASDQFTSYDSKQSYENTLQFRRRIMNQEDDSYLDEYKRFLDGELTLTLIKKFDKTVIFQEAQLVPKGYLLDSFASNYEGKTLYFEEFTKERNLEIIPFENNEYSVIQPSNKKELVSIIIGKPEQENMLMGFYDELSHVRFVWFVSDIDHNKRVNLKMNCNRSVAEVFNIVWAEFVGKEVDKDIIYLKYFENNSTFKMIYNDESIEDQPLIDLVGGVNQDNLQTRHLLRSDALQVPRTPHQV